MIYFAKEVLKQPSSSYKKARLDIDIIPSQQYIEQQQQLHRTVKTTTTVAKSSSADSLWGDEDDEFIILASQAVEEVEMFQQTQMQQSQASRADVTFGTFLKEGVASSTQTVANGVREPNSSELMPPPPSAVPGPSRVDAVPISVVDLLTDGDDDVFSEQFDENYDNIEKHIDEFFNNEFDDDFNMDEFQQDNRRSGSKTSQERSPKPSRVNGETKASPVTFQPKKPQAAVITKEVFANKAREDRTILTQKHPPQIDREAIANAAKKRDHEKDMQVRYLTGQLERASKEKEQLKKDYNEVTERLQIRDGEVSILRYEMKNIKDQNKQLRMEKMKETETLKKDWVEKMKDLEKVIVVQKSELEFKTMEIINLKTKRMSNSFKHGSTKEKPVTEKDFRTHTRRVQLFRQSSTDNYQINPSIFDLSAETVSKFNTKNQLSILSREDIVLSQLLGSLQSYLSRMMCLKGAFPEECIASIAQIAIQATEEIRAYSRRLPLVRLKDAHLRAKVAHDFICKNSKRDRLEGSDVNIYQKQSVFLHEKAIVPRRLLAALGLLCQYVPSLAVRLVRRSRGSETCINVLSKALDKIGYASDLYGHMGLVAAAATFLSGLSWHVLQYKEHGRVLMDLFKSIVFCRPDAALILTHLSEILYRISASNDSIDLLNSLCRQSKASDFAPNEVYKMLQFTKDSCSLQIYAALLEATVPQHRELTQTEIRYLVTNTRNTIYFLRNSIARPVRWISDFVHRPEGAVLAHCQCHIRIANAFVVLLHQVLRCWMQCLLSIDFDTMLQITQNGVLLLFDLFETVYRKEVLQVGRHIIQSRLQATYNWLVQMQGGFRFQPTHKNALQLLDLRLVMEEPLKCNEDIKRMDVDEDATDQISSKKNRRSNEIDAMYSDMFEDYFSSKVIIHK
ncbi:ATR-interacting protein mus304 isoform X2 [Armigeres subalbatus]|uniref:ATR-interacting protein mus304 isoform X2 n=1 Tax=Armigeres subalbatus TaxID=124917 RepID=UPI002ECFBD82